MIDRFWLVRPRHRRPAAISRPAPDLLIGLVMGAFIGVVRSASSLDQLARERRTAKLAEQHPLGGVCACTGFYATSESPGFVLLYHGMNIHSP